MGRRLEGKASKGLTVTFRGDEEIKVIDQFILLAEKEKRFATSILKSLIQAWVESKKDESQYQPTFMKIGCELKPHECEKQIFHEGWIECCGVKPHACDKQILDENPSEERTQ